MVLSGRSFQNAIQASLATVQVMAESRNDGRRYLLAVRLRPVANSERSALAVTRGDAPSSLADLIPKRDRTYTTDLSTKYVPR